MKGSLVPVLLIFVLAFTVGCVSMGPRSVVLSTPALPAVVRVAGATDMAPFVDTLRERAKAHTPAMEIRYTPTNSTSGVRLLAEGRADVALLSWLPETLPQGIVAYPVGEDDIAIVVYPRVGVTDLSLEEVRRVFEGRYLTWAELGGADMPVRLVSREEGSGTRAAFAHLVMVGTPVALSAIVMPSGQDVVDYVARHEGAIGYVSARLVVDEVQMLAVEGKRPGEAEYPLRRALYIALSDRSPAWTRELVEALIRPEGE